MPRCTNCEAEFPADGEWLELAHHHPNMTFDSTFCSVACAGTYLTGALQRTPHGE